MTLVRPLALGEHTSIRYAIRPTYWDGINLVAAAPCLFGAEFALTRQTQELRTSSFGTCLTSVLTMCVPSTT